MTTDYKEVLAADDAAAVVETCTAKGACVDAADWLAQADEPDDPLVDGFIEVGEVVAMVGQSKAGKSLLALQLAVCVALGVPFIGKECTRRRVFIANLEVSAKQYKKRLRRICKRLGVSGEALRGWLFIGNMKGETATWDAVLALCRAHGCEAAIIDPFYQIARIVETDEQQCLDAVEQMKKFAQAGITLCIVFHSPKGFSGDRQLIDMISGSSILARFPESIIGLLNHATDKTARVVDAVLRNYPPPDPFAVSLAEGVLELAQDVTPEVATSKNAWNRKKNATAQTDLSPFIFDTLSEMEAAAKAKGEKFKGVPVGVLADKARKRYLAKNGGALGEKRMPSEIKTLKFDGNLVVTERIGHNGPKFVGTPEQMKWFTDPEPQTEGSEE